MHHALRTIILAGIIYEEHLKGIVRPILPVDPQQVLHGLILGTHRRCYSALYALRQSTREMDLCSVRHLLTIDLSLGSCMYIQPFAYLLSDFPVSESAVAATFP
ncbi:hypothetical protein P7K49_027962, partial [Saguinus oedipus]